MENPEPRLISLLPGQTKAKLLCGQANVLTVCNYTVYGCMDTAANNYIVGATMDTCDTCGCQYWGCVDSIADNYDSSANVMDYSCQYTGCMDLEAMNWNPQATQV